jgi:hypothetical protein
MKILLPACNNDEYYDGADYCIIDLTPALHKKIKKLCRISSRLSKLDGFYATQFFSYDVDWYDWDESFDEFNLEEDCYAILPDDFKIPENKRVRVECQMLTATTDGVIWNAIVKFTGVEVSHDRITLEWIAEITDSSDLIK